MAFNKKVGGKRAILLHPINEQADFHTPSKAIA